MKKSAQLADLMTGEDLEEDMRLLRGSRGRQRKCGTRSRRSLSTFMPMSQKRHRVIATRMAPFSHGFQEPFYLSLGQKVLWTVINGGAGLG
jgi:hypothetical protein